MMVRFAALLLVLCSSSPSLAALNTLILGADQQRILLGRHLEYLEDPDGRWTIDDVSSGPPSEHFTPSRHKILNFGHTRSAYWVRFRLDTSEQRSLERYLLVDWPLTDSLELYMPFPDGRFEVESAGDHLPFAVRRLDYRNPVFPLLLEPSSPRTFYMRFAGADALIIRLLVVSQEALIGIRIAEGVWFGAYYGILAIIGIYNAAIFVFLRDRSYLHLVLLILAVLVWHVAVDGLAYQYLWPDFPWWANHVVGMAGGTAGVCFVAFVRSFLLTWRHTPTLDPVLRLLGVGALLMIVVAAIDMRMANALAVPLGTALFGASLAAAAQCWRDGFTPGRDFLVAWAFCLMFTMLYGVDATYGLFQSEVVQVFGLHVAALTTATLLSVALARRLNLLKDEHERSELLLLQKEDADRKNLEKSKFLAAASHDLRQPLHTLGLFVGALEQNVREPQDRELIEKIKIANRSLEAMFDSVLDISKLDAGGVEVNVRDFAVRDLLDQLRSEFEPQAAARGLRLGVAKSGLIVRSDPLLLSRIMRNLITNALLYTDRGGVVVGCRPGGSSEARLEVYDTGRGIPEDRHAEIFREYHRIEDSGGPPSDGLGLGLAIVDRLARLLGHEVRLRSTPGRGSVFTVKLQRGSAPAGDFAGTDPLPAGGDLAGSVVLVVDDDPTILHGMRALLQRWGCEVLSAGTLDDACSMSTDRAPDAILSDYQLGAMITGIDVIAAIRATIGNDVPALLITGDTAAEAASEARRAGFILLRKPVAPARLRAALSQLLRQRRSGPRGSSAAGTA